MAIYLKITNSTEVVQKKTSKWLTDITPERIDRKLVEDEVIKGIIEQLTLEGIKGEISAISGFDVKDSTLVTKNNFLVREMPECGNSERISGKYTFFCTSFLFLRG